MRISYSVTNGGYLKLYNRDSGSAIITRYYSGRTTSAQATFTYDFVEPHHCLGESGGCRTGMLDPGDNVVTQVSLPPPASGSLTTAVIDSLWRNWKC